jgi:hypothetical protein
MPELTGRSKREEGKALPASFNYHAPDGVANQALKLMSVR